MKRLNIHGPMRWGIRLIYAGVILVLAGYLGFGLFLKSRLAGDLLVKQLSAQAGRPVHVGRVRLDWLHGFHVVLKDVVVPSLNGGPPPIYCDSMVTTIELWPLVFRQEVIFKQIALKDGVLRLRRSRTGKWRGAFVVPVTPVSKTPENKESKKAKRHFALFFPKVSLRHILIELILETKGGNRVYRMFLKKADTMASQKTKRIRGNAQGTLQLHKSPRHIAFQAQGTYALAPPFSFNISIHLAGLSLRELNNFSPIKSNGHFRGMSKITLTGSGELERGFTFYGQFRVQNPRFHSSKCLITTPDPVSVFAIEGRGKGFSRGSPEISIKITNPAQTVHVKWFKNGREIYSQRGRFYKMILKGDMAVSPMRLKGSLTCDYRLGEKDETERPSSIRIRGNWTAQAPERFDLSVSATRVPLMLLLREERQKELPPELKAQPTPAIVSPPLRTLDRFEGNVSGEITTNGLLLRNTRMALVWGPSRLVIYIDPFRVAASSPLIFRVRGSHLTPGTARSTPFILHRLPPSLQAWARSILGGEIRNLEGNIVVKRDAKGIPRGIKVQSAILKLSQLSFTVPSWSLPVNGLSGTFYYQAPTLRVTGLQARLMDNLVLTIKRLSSPDLSKRPFSIQCVGETASQGIRLDGKNCPSRLAALLRILLKRGYIFTPEFFSGHIQGRFEGTLFPLSVSQYGISLNNVLLKGKLTRGNGSIQMPVTFTVHADASPEKIEVVHAALKTPLGTIISKGTAQRNPPSKTWQIDASGSGYLSFDQKNLYTFLSRLSAFRATGKMPFSIKVRGSWPQLTLQGELDGKSLYCRYKDIFIKDTGVPASIDFQINQAAPQSFEINSIRAKLRGFVVKIWGVLSAFNPLRGKFFCETNTHQIQRLMPLFPRFCSGKQCLLAKGDIQCTGQVEFQKILHYEIKAVLANVSLPFPGETEPITIAKATLLMSDRARLLHIEDALYRESYATQISLAGKRKEGKWLWSTRLALGYLNLDDFIRKLRHSNGKQVDKRPRQSSKKDLVTLLINMLHGKYIRGSVSVQNLKVLNYPLHDLFTRFHQKGKDGAIRGFNFLTDNNGYGAIDASWQETGKGKIILKLSPLVKNLDFGKILDGLLHRTSPFRGWLTFNGHLTARGESYETLKDGLKGHLTVTFKKGLIAHWAVMTSIFQLLDIYDIVTLRNLPAISSKGLEYSEIHGTIQVQRGIAKTDDAYLKSQPFYMSGQGTLQLATGRVTLLIGVYPFKVLDSVISHIPIVGRIFTNKDKKFIGYFFKATGPVTHPKVTSVNAKKLGERVWDTFKKIITLPLYPFQDHTKQGEKK